MGLDAPRGSAVLVPCVAGRWSSLILLVEQAERSIGPNSGLAEPQKFLCCRTAGATKVLSHCQGQDQETFGQDTGSGNLQVYSRLWQLTAAVLESCAKNSNSAWWSGGQNLWPGGQWSIPVASGQWPKHSSPEGTTNL